MEKIMTVRELLASRHVQNLVYGVADRMARYEMANRTSIVNSGRVKSLLLTRYRAREREVFGVIFLNNQHEVIEMEEIFQGTIASAPVHPREVLKRCLQLNAAAIIVFHNHPSGIAEPSKSDIAITRDLQKACALLDIRLVDHLVIGKAEASSFSELGLL